jgi:PadR family transcriptional regulator PadR
MDTERELLKGNTPTLVMAVLRDGPLHGYGIAREIERRSGTALTCKEGTLYPALHSLEREGLVQSEWRRDEGSRERKVYVLTPAGLTALEERARAWERFASAIHRVIKGDADAGTSEAPERGRPGRGRREGPSGSEWEPAL